MVWTDPAMIPPEARKAFAPGLYVVATPLGHLSDFSSRAREVLDAADVILCEDTRVTRRILTAFSIVAKRLQSYHDHNEEQRAQRCIDEMNAQPQVVALVTDAGTPCISDPGYRIVHLAHQSGIRVVPVPGPSAPITLLAASGLPSDRFVFIGFLPNKKSAILSEIEDWPQYRATVIFFERAQRLLTTLEHIEQRFPQALVCVGRELTKLHEEIKTALISEIIVWWREEAVTKGEISVAISIPRPKKQLADEQQRQHHDELLTAELMHKLQEGATVRKLLGEYTRQGYSRGHIYPLLLQAQKTIRGNE